LILFLEAHVTLSAYRAPALLAAAILLPASGPARAQWLHYKTPGIPRTADGKPDLSAPAPRMPDGKPDFTGVWQLDSARGKETTRALESIKPQPSAAALSKQRVDNFGRENPLYSCMPPGPMVTVAGGRIVQTPNLLLNLFGGTLYREVFLDGRPMPEIVNPDWMGYSLGRWDGDTLVVETTGFNDKTWLDFDGHPHTEALNVTERFRRPDFGHLEILKTLVDPGALVEPWTIPLKLEFDADNDPLEMVGCENERDLRHFVGKASDQKGITVAPEILSRYVGSYELKLPDSHRTDILEVKLTDGQLTLSGAILPKTSLKPTSETEFSTPIGEFMFERDVHGRVTDLVLRAVEGDIKAPRK
jgi:hypothetical protein